MPAPKPTVNRKVQPRTWNLETGTFTANTSATKGNKSPVYSTDLFSVEERWSNGVGSNLHYNTPGEEDERIGIYLEKITASNADSASFSNAESYLDGRVYDDTTTLYNLDVTKRKGNAPLESSIDFVWKSNSTALFWSRDYAQELESLPLDTFGTYRLVAYAGETEITGRNTEGKLEDAEALEIEVFELRGLAITNLKSTPERIEVDGVVREVTITGDITVFPNFTDNNGATAWTPTNDIEWRVAIKHPTIPQGNWVVFESGVNGVLPITPTAPDANGVVGSFSVTWNGTFGSSDGPPYDPSEVAFGEMTVEARALTQVSNPTRNVITPTARIGVVCKKCQAKQTNPFAEVSETIELFNSALGELSTSFSYSSSESGNSTGSMGYGWFSTENIKIVRPLNDDTDLVYCDETGMTRRWVLDSGSYVPVLPDNQMTLTVDSGSTNARYVVTWRDRSRREFDTSGYLRKFVDSNENETTYDRQTGYLAVSDGKGRTVYQHFNAGEPQPVVVNDNVNPSLGRRYLLEYDMDGSEQKRLKSITNPVGENVEFLYDENGRMSERRQVFDNHTRSVFYTYDESNTGRLKSMKASSTLRQANPDPDIITDHNRVDYEYNVPFEFDKDGACLEPLVTYNTTKFTVTDLEDPSNPPRVSYLAYDSLSRIVAEFEEALDDTDEDGEYDDLTYIATLHFYEDSNDPWLRTKTEQINKGTTTHYEYTARGNLSRILDAQNNETVVTYTEDVPGHPAAASFPDLVTEIRRPAPDLDGAPSTFYPTTKFFYDPVNGNLTGVEDAQGETSSFRYNPEGQVERLVNRRGFKTYLEYDAKARLSKVFVQKGLNPTIGDDDYDGVDASDYRKLELSYDSYDNVTQVLDANGDTVSAAYDDMDRPTTVTDGESVNTVFDYLDGVLQQISLPDSSGSSGAHTGRLALMEYDSAGRPLAVKREDSSNSAQLRVGYGYDGFSQLRSLTRLKNGLEKSHTSTYDRQGRTVSSTDFNGKTSTAAYEPFCGGFATTSARGVRRRASFDTLCRLTQVEVGTPDSDPLEVATPSESREFEYDDLGRLIKTVQSTSAPSTYGVATFGVGTYGAGASQSEERSYQYDSLDRPTKITFEDGKTMEYEYDEEGNVKKITENASSSTPKVTEFSYYGDNRLYQVTYVRASGNQIFTYAYDDGGRPLTLTYPTSTGIVAHFDGPLGEDGWDGNGQLLHLRYIKGGTTVIRRFEYQYDDSGNRISQLDVTPTKATKWEYGYDWLDRLESVKKAEAATVGALGALQLVSVYQYDAADNRTEFQVPNLNPALTETFTYSYKDGDDIESISKTVGSGSPVVIETFTSDDDGNLLTRASGGVTTYYTWDDFNRLKAISTSDNSKKQTQTFGVNGFRRKKKDKNDIETTEYAAGLETAVSKAQAGDTVTYLMGGGGITGFERTSDGAMFYFITDALTTVRDVVNNSGTVVASYEFSEYGQKISPANTGGIESQKTFVGGMSVQDEVADTGLMLMGHRFYDPGLLGRFLNRDPIGHAGGLNLFTYAGTNPTTLVDSNGLNPFEETRVVQPTELWTGVGSQINATTNLEPSFRGLRSEFSGRFTLFQNMRTEDRGRSDFYFSWEMQNLLETSSTIRYELNVYESVAVNFGPELRANVPCLERKIGTLRDHGFPLRPGGKTRETRLVELALPEYQYGNLFLELKIWIDPHPYFDSKGRRHVFVEGFNRKLIFIPSPGIQRR